MKKKASAQSGPDHHEQANCETCPTKSKGFMCSTNDEISKTISHIKIDCHYKSGDFLFHAGSLPLGLYSVRSGVVKIENLSSEGQAHTVKLVGAGGLVGYRSFFAGEKHHSSAIVVEDCDICFLPSSEVHQLFKCHPELGLKMIAQLAEDVKNAETKWVNQIDKGAPARVAEALIFLSDKFTEAHWTRKEIAEWAGTTTETVIRTLALFEKEGLITQNYKNFSILKRELLIEKSLG
jgi:CRP-like cAMP-binding protein